MGNRKPTPREFKKFNLNKWGLYVARLTKQQIRKLRFQNGS